MEYDEFQLLLQPAIQPAGQPTLWTAEIRGCPMPAFISPAIQIAPTLTRAQLFALRTPAAADLGQLRTIGGAVWSSIMPATVEAAFKACSAFMEQQLPKKGMRLVVTVQGNPANGMGLANVGEIPFESLFDPFLEFIALSEKTPVSRRLLAAPDRDPLPMRYPLRILVVAATPTDQAPAKIDDEKQVILTALQEAVAKGIIEIEFCDPPTRATLLQKLTKDFHVLHFIGHGGFDVVGADPTPVPHLCFEAPATPQGLRPTDPVDADTLRMILNDRKIRLVVLTACSTATIIPTDTPDYPVRAYDGVAQILLTGNSPLSAVVAMQFDLDAPAATEFSRSFYSELLKAGTPLDIVVYRARKALAAMFNIGQRSWITPVLYWRCKDGQVFDIAQIAGSLSPEALQQIALLDVTRQTVEEGLKDMDNEPKSIRAALTKLRKQMQKRLNDIADERAQILGETLRVHGGTVQPGRQIDCRVALRMRSQGTIGAVQFTLNYPPEVTFRGKKSAGAMAAPIVDSSTPGQLIVHLGNASTGQNWDAVEHDLCFLTFQVDPAIGSSYIKLPMQDSFIERDALNTPIDTLEGVLTIDFSEPS